MAEAFVNHYARRHGLDVVGKSAGTVGGKSLNPMAVEAMREAGISMDGQSPKMLSQDMIQSGTVPITMGCGVDAEACPAKFIVMEDWGLDDPAGQDMETVRRIRTAIDARVRALLGIA